MTSSPDAFGAIAFPRLGTTAPAERSAEERGYAAGLARARAHAERRHAQRLAALEAEATAREAARAREHREAMTALVAATAAVTRAAQPVLESAERELAGAALDLAEAIVGAELGADPDGAARLALDRVLDHPDAPLALRVRMHPDDLAALASPSGATAGADALPEFVADASLGRGDAIAELPDGLVDARIGAALARARRALEERS